MGTDRDTAGQSDAAHRSPDLDAVLAQLAFDPGDPASVAAAISRMDAAIDAKVAPYGLNPDVQAMAEGKKQAYRDAIRQRAQAPHQD